MTWTRERFNEEADRKRRERDDQEPRATIYRFPGCNVTDLYPDEDPEPDPPKAA